MKPGHIRVFDGLRITTEHMNHLQASFHSAIQDLRGVLGLGRVHRGFETAKVEDTKIRVEPGIAFDSKKNRVALTEPLVLDVEWKAEGEDEKFVVARYRQVEDGVVEGRPTIVWDSCAVEIVQEAPPPEGNGILIARLKKSNGEDGTFEVYSPAEETHAEEEGEAEASEAEMSVLAEEETEEPPEPAGENAEETVAVEVEETEIPGEAKPVESSLEPKEEAGETVAAEIGEMEEGLDVMVEGAQAPKVFSKQGVERLETAVEEGLHIGALLLEPMKTKLGRDKSIKDAELLFTLTEKEVVLTHRISDLSCHTVIDIELSSPGSEEAEEGSSEAVLELQSSAQGEATFSNGEVSQYGLSTVRVLPMGSEGMQLSYSDLTEHGIAHLPWNSIIGPAVQERFEVTPELMECLVWFVRIEGIEKTGFRLVCYLKWNGEITGETLDTVAALRLLAVPKFSVGWKANLASRGEPAERP
jgi:hypothetical protein